MQSAKLSATVQLRILASKKKKTWVTLRVVVGIAAFFATSGLPLLVISRNSRHHKPGNNFSVGQWFLEHPESDYQSTIAVASSSFTSESKMIFSAKSDLSEPPRISASAELPSLPQSGLMSLLVQLYQGLQT